MAIETNRTYDRLMEKLKVEFNDLEDKRCWRDVRIIQTMPFYETKFYTEYFGYAAKIYNWLKGCQGSRTNKFRNDFNKWAMAMTPDASAFSSLKSYQQYTWPLKDITTSTWMIKSNHHYYRYYTLTGKDPNDFDRIVEVGGGCGDMCKFINLMGFKGEYIIVDLPQVQEIQKRNLRDFTNVKWTTKPVKKDSKKKTLFISTWALSELTLAWREELIDALKPDSYLITYQREFEDINNEEWFSTWEGYREELPWIKWDGGSSYILK